LKNIRRQNDCAQNRQRHVPYLSVKEDSEENLEIPQAKGKIEKNINNKVIGLTKLFNLNKKPIDLLGVSSAAE